MILGTAGHVDHGKSTLVRLLSGTDPDRWEEEQRRGLTIGLGYGFIDLPGVGSAAIIDVPGHNRFLPAMLQGAHGVDITLLAVAAHEGWMPQTAEHVAILDALGTRSGVVVLTHADRVSDADLVALVGDLQERLEGTFLAAAVSDPSEVVRVDGTNGSGMVELRHRLGCVASEVATGPAHAGWMVGSGRPRLWVDRSFLLGGVGRVCTGTLTGGSLAVGDRIEVVRSRSRGGPSTSATRVDSIQVHGDEADVAHSGTRVGLRLASSRIVPEVGDALVHRSQWGGGRHLHAALRPFQQGSSGPVRELNQRRGYDLVVGTARWPVELRRSPRVPGPLVVEGSEERWSPVRLHSAHEIGPVAPGDRFVLIDSSTARAVAGGVLLAVHDTVVRLGADELGTRLGAVLSADTAALTDALLAERRGTAPEAVIVTEVGSIADGIPTDGRHAFHPELLTDLRSALLGEMAAPNGFGGIRVGTDPARRRVVADLVAQGRVVVSDGLVRVSGGEDPSDRIEVLAGGRLWRRAELMGVLRQAGLPEETLASATRSGSLVCVSRSNTRGGAGDPGRGSARRPGATERLVGRATMDRFAQLVADRLAESAATLAELRDALGLSRSDSLAVLEHLDRTGVTLRNGEVRTAGPNAPKPRPRARRPGTG